MAASRQRRKSRAAALLELGTGGGAAVGVLITAHQATVHRAAAFHCDTKAAASCIGQATSNTLQTYLVAGVVGAVIGLMIATVLVVIWHRILAA
jgi:hypothetical protein